MDHLPVRLYLIGGIAGGLAIIAAALSLMQYSTEEYALDVDAFKDRADVFESGRVMITNIGRLTVTNIVIDYGNYSETIPALPSGEKIMASPRPDTPLNQVTVTADNGIHITKEYRSVARIPGMIGGMG